jgi:uncharacterized protein YbaR (Trm112 family)
VAARARERRHGDLGRVSTVAVAARNSVHLLLTDILTCPRCGPDSGLILLADRIVERRVITGVLGCPTCREHYPVRDGAVYCGGKPGLPGTRAEAEAAVRLAALTGVTPGNRFALLAGPAAAHAAELAALVEGLEVIAVGEPNAALPIVVDAPGVNLLGAGSRLPLATGRVAGVALTGRCADFLLEEGARVLAPGGRLLLDPAPPDAAARLAAVGLRVVARDATAVVAEHTGTAPAG